MVVGRCAHVLFFGRTHVSFLIFYQHCLSQQALFEEEKKKKKKKKKNKVK
jgi:hypothetical protein